MCIVIIIFFDSSSFLFIVFFLLLSLIFHVVQVYTCYCRFKVLLDRAIVSSVFPEETKRSCPAIIVLWTKAAHTPLLLEKPELRSNEYKTIPGPYCSKVKCPINPMILLPLHLVSLHIKKPQDARIHSRHSVGRKDW